jgi:hypothetical protein
MIDTHAFGPHRIARWLVALIFGACVTAHVRDANAAPPWVERHLTLPAGDWAFDFGLGVGHVPPFTCGPACSGPNDLGVGINGEMSVGVTRRVELGVRTGVAFGDPLERGIRADQYGRLFDRQTFDTGIDTFANPELRVRGAVVRGDVAEVALEGRLVLPFADGTGAGLLFGVPLAFHLGNRVRLDTGPYVPVVFPPHMDAQVALSAPIDLWIQATSRFWLGPMSGLRFGQLGRDDGRTDVSLGLGLGYQITHAFDFKAMFLFPRLNNESRDFGFGAGIEVRIE